MGLTAHLARRGIEHVARRAVWINGQEAPDFDVPKWGIAVMTVTWVLFAVFMSSLEYTLKNVIATLAMIDSPTALITVTPTEQESLDSKDLKEPLLETGPTVTTVRAKPVTSSIRGTLRHLVATAGMFSRWRGLPLFVLYCVSFFFTASVIEAILPRFPGSVVIVSAITGALVAPLHAAWTHKVISMPQTKPLSKYVPGLQAWKALALPAAVHNSVAYLSIFILQGLIVVLGVNNMAGGSPDDWKKVDGGDIAIMVGKCAAVIATMVFCGLFIILPATVTLIRVEASLLPEEEDTIVPFDRSFGGKVLPRVLGGTGAVGFLEAWKSFNWEARRRVLKLYVKISAIMTVLVLVFMHIMVFEVWAIMGPAVQKWLSQAEKQGVFGDVDNSNVHWEGY
jgi:hypothetical protein